MSMLTRKKFITSSISGATGMILLPPLVTGRSTRQTTTPGKELLDTELVKEFVIAGHNDLNKVKSMLQDNPDLLNASFNWKDWDWEDAIGGAGHMGFREMALYLLEQGARPTICVAAMLGNLDVVKTFINAFPQMKSAVGPHKISLVRHAKAGGEKAREVLEYLQSVGAKE